MRVLLVHQSVSAEKPRKCSNVQARDWGERMAKIAGFLPVSVAFLAFSGLYWQDILTTDFVPSPTHLR
jgi:hypothetical protein